MAMFSFTKVENWKNVNFLPKCTRLHQGLKRTLWERRVQREDRGAEGGVERGSVGRGCPLLTEGEVWVELTPEIFFDFES